MEEPCYPASDRQERIRLWSLGFQLRLRVRGGNGHRGMCRSPCRHPFQQKKHTEFDSELLDNIVEIRHLPQELQITMGSDILGDVEREEVISDMVFNNFRAHFAQK